MNKLRVLYITNIPAPYRVDFFNELSRYCDLTVIYENTASTERNKDWTLKASGDYKQLFLKGLTIGRNSKLCMGVLGHLSRGSYDKIVVGGYATPTASLAITALRLRKIPFFLNADGGFIPEHESVLKRSIKRYLISAATWWLSTGDITDKYLISYGADAKKIFTYPFTSVRQADVLSTPISKQEKLKIREQKGLHCEVLFLAVGQFINRKGFYDFLKEWTSKERGNIGIAIIGGGEQEQKYKELARKSNNVWILPFLKKDDLAEYYSAADGFAMPTNEDIWGLVVNEAMAMGLPVFSTDKCISAMSMKCEGVKIFPVGDNKKMISALEEFATNDNYSAAEVLNKSSNYTIEKMTEKHIEIFERAQVKK